MAARDWTLGELQIIDGLQVKLMDWLAKGADFGGPYANDRRRIGREFANAFSDLRLRADEEGGEKFLVITGTGHALLGKLSRPRDEECLRSASEQAKYRLIRAIIDAGHEVHGFAIAGMGASWVSAETAYIIAVKIS